MASLDLYSLIRAMHHGLSKEGGGGSPHLFPSQSMMGLFSHWPIPSHVTLLVLYKKPPVPFHLSHSMDDPVLSPEAQQVIDRLRALLSRLEKDLEQIRFKASYFELLRLHSQKHLSRNELGLLTLKNFYRW